MRKFFDSVVQDANAITDFQDVPMLGHHEAIWQSHLGLYFRWPASASWSKDHHFRIFQDAPAESLPMWAQTIECCISMSPSSNANIPNPCVIEVEQDDASALTTPVKKNSGTTIQHNSDSEDSCDQLLNGFQVRTSSTPTLQKKRAASSNQVNAANKRAALASGFSSSALATLTAGGSKSALKSGKGQQPPPAGGVAFNSLPEFDPMSNPDGTTNRTASAADSLWCTPEDQDRHSALPIGASNQLPHQLEAIKRAEGIAVAARKEDKKEDCNRLLFHRDSMLDATFPHILILRKASTWLAIGLPEGTQATAVSTPIHKYHDSNLVAPGFLSHEFRSHMLLSMGKPTTSPTFQQVTTWFRNNVVLGQTFDNEGPMCYFVEGFFTADTVGALLACNFGFEPAICQSLTLTTTVVSSWITLGSARVARSQHRPTVPPTGLRAANIFQWVQKHLLPISFAESRSQPL